MNWLLEQVARGLDVDLGALVSILVERASMPAMSLTFFDGLHARNELVGAFDDERRDH